MKLRFPSQLQQLLSAAACAFLLDCAATAQTDAILIMQDNSQRPTKVYGMTPTGTTLEIGTPDGTGRLGLQVAQIKEVRMAPPPELGQGFAAYYAKDYAKALPTTREDSKRN